MYKATTAFKIRVPGFGWGGAMLQLLGARTAETALGELLWTQFPCTVLVISGFCITIVSNSFVVRRTGSHMKTAESDLAVRATRC